MEYLMIFSIYFLGYAISYGVIFASFQREFPSVADIVRDRDRSMARNLSIFWPVTIIITILVFGFHGIKFK